MTVVVEDGIADAPAVWVEVTVIGSVEIVGEATMKTREAIDGTPLTFGWENLRVYVPGAKALSVMRGQLIPE